MPSHTLCYLENEVGEEVVKVSLHGNRLLFPWQPHAVLLGELELLRAECE